MHRHTESTIAISNQKPLVIIQYDDENISVNQLQGRHRSNYNDYFYCKDIVHISIIINLIISMINQLNMINKGM